MFDLDDLFISWLHVKTKSLQAGIDRITPKYFAIALDENLCKLQRQLDSETYAPMPAMGFRLSKKGGEHRLVGLHTVCDRIVQRSILQTAYPLFESQYSPYSFAYRIGYSTHQAVRTAMAWICSGFPWVLKIDIAQFFDSLSRPLLLALLEQMHLPDQLINLIELQVKTPLMLDGQILPIRRGVLQGGILSGALANLYLSQFDRQCIDQPIGFVRYFGRLETASQAEVEYLKQQVQRSSDPEFSLRLAISFVYGKVHNSRILLQRLCRRHPHPDAEKAIASLTQTLEQVRLAKTIESLRGYEGHSAHLYFQGLASLFLHDRFVFEKRSIRPPQNPINSLLSLGYTLLHHLIHSNVQMIGLHPNFGHLHVSKRHHPSLVMDLIEEFRSQIVDSFVVYLINSKIFTPEDFTPPDARGGVYLYPDGLKRFLKHWEEKLQTEVKHPNTGHKVSYRRCLELQAWEYVFCITGERPDYRPMLWEK